MENRYIKNLSVNYSKIQEGLEELYKLSKTFKSNLDKYALETKQIDGIYFEAKKMFAKIEEKAYQDKEYRIKFIFWLKHGKTLKLQDLVREVNHAFFNNNIKFNAFTLLDTVHCINQYPYKK